MIKDWSLKMSKLHGAFDRSFVLPPVAGNPSTKRQGTSPGSFANKGAVGTAMAYSSPDTPGMPGVSSITAMDFAREEDSARARNLKLCFSFAISSAMKHVATREPHLTSRSI
jgi:hypothetical protein